MRFVKSSPITEIFYGSAVTYPAPSNISYMWNFGIYAFVCLLVQIVTGLLLVMHYIPSTDLAFASMEHLMRDVNFGWLLRYVHANGASMFFIVVYSHIIRGMFFGSYMYPRIFLWMSGVLIFFLMIITAFLGYILPWGQMSFWGATVITNLASTIPVVGEKVVIWLWGAFSVDQPTLGKFFSLHFLFPFVILGLVLLHLVFLHTTGSNNPLGISAKNDSIPFTPYFTIKDLFSVLLFVAFFAVFVFFVPNLLGHPDNYIVANPSSTPAHIVPEWYFLPFYAILRSIPDKLTGVIALLGSILVLFALPFIHTNSFRVSSFKPLTKILILLFFANAVILCIIGGKPVEEPYVFIGRVSTFFYFIFFVLIKPVNNLEDRLLTNLGRSTWGKKGRKNTWVTWGKTTLAKNTWITNLAKNTWITNLGKNTWVYHYQFQKQEYTFWMMMTWSYYSWAAFKRYPFGFVVLFVFWFFELLVLIAALSLTIVVLKENVFQSRAVLWILVKIVVPFIDSMILYFKRMALWIRIKNGRLRPLKKRLIYLFHKWW